MGLVRFVASMTGVLVSGLMSGVFLDVKDYWSFAGSIFVFIGCIGFLVAEIRESIKYFNGENKLDVEEGDREK